MTIRKGDRVEVNHPRVGSFVGTVSWRTMCGWRVMPDPPLRDSLSKEQVEKGGLACFDVTVHLLQETSR